VWRSERQDATFNVRRWPYKRNDGDSDVDDRIPIGAQAFARTQIVYPGRAGTVRTGPRGAPVTNTTSTTGHVGALAPDAGPRILGIRRSSSSGSVVDGRSVAGGKRRASVVAWVGPASNDVLADTGPQLASSIKTATRYTVWPVDDPTTVEVIRVT